jgi:hypothetical protein
MPIFKKGLDVEDRLYTILEKSGFTLKRDPGLDHQHKIDFVILSFPDNLSYQALGVQVTGRLNDYQKQEEFQAACQANSKISKSLYMEIADRVDLDSGGGWLAISAIMNYQFNAVYRDSRTMGTVIQNDNTYGFFDLSERVAKLKHAAQVGLLPRPAAAAASAAGSANGTYSLGDKLAQAVVKTSPDLHEGAVTSYVREKGFGFIRAESNVTYFFNIKFVTDDRLREELNSLPFGFSGEIIRPVQFSDMGFTKSEAKYKEARDIRPIA